MRVLEPKKFKHRAVSGSKKIFPRSITFLIMIIIVTTGGLYGYSVLQRVTPIDTPEPTTSIVIPEHDPHDITTKPLRQLSGDGFKELYNAVALPNTQEIIDPPSITGDDRADSRIRYRAEQRGYKLSRIPMNAITKIKDEPRLDTDDLLQPLAADAWYKMREAARKQGYPISLLSAYRTPQYQQELFYQRLRDRGVSIEQIANGDADNAIDTTLEITAVPGYSRHHTGYTIDLWCEDGSSTFLSSRCYAWMSENNYRNAMEFGWIPSYPEGATEQGPEPEPWEYVWVGNAVRQP